MIDLMAAVFARWNAAGLNTTIAPLFPAGEGRSATQNRGGAPEGTELPRAEYFITRGPPDAKSRKSRTYQAIATIQIWTKGTSDGTASLLAGQYVKAIHNAFVNADEAGMGMEDGDILEVDDGGEFVFTQDDDVVLGQKQIVIRHRLDNKAP